MEYNKMTTNDTEKRTNMLTYNIAKNLTLQTSALYKMVVKVKFNFFFLSVMFMFAFYTMRSVCLEANVNKDFVLYFAILFVFSLFSAILQVPKMISSIFYQRMIKEELTMLAELTKLMEEKDNDKIENKNDTPLY